MFITKKNYERAIHNAVSKVQEKHWMQERFDNIWSTLNRHDSTLYKHEQRIKALEEQSNKK